jgi:hypothetical protein
MKPVRIARVLSIAVMISIAAATPSHAGDLDDFTGFLGYVKTGYELFDKYVLDGDPSEVAQMQAIVNQAKTQIIAELDGLTAAWNSSCAANAVDTFQNIDKLGTDALQAFAISSDKCVTDAQAQIGAVTDKGAIDKIGFALNTVGPVALLANARAGFVTDALKQHIIDANRQLQQKLAPTCDVSIDSPDALPGWGEGAVTGHGACYNYTVPKPARVSVGERGGVFYLTPGPGKAFLPWPLRGDAVPDDDLLPWRGYTVGFPVVDYSIAINQVMQGTSWQVAGAVLDQLAPSVGPAGSPLAMTTGSGKIYEPVSLFHARGDDGILRGALNPYPDGSSPTFSGWHELDGTLRSIAAVGNADGRVEIFGISRIGNVFHRWQQVAGDNNSWLSWAQMDGQLNSITVARNQDGTLQVFGTDVNGAIWTRNQILGGDQFQTVRPVNPVPAIDSWTPWKQMDGILVQASAVTGADNRIHLFGINGSGMLWHRQQAVRNATDPSVAGAWTSWEQVDTPTPLQRLAVTIDLGGRLNIIGIDNADRIFQRVKLGDGTVYTNWVQLPGSLHEVTATKEGGGAGEIVLLGINANGTIYRNTSYGLVSLTQNGWMPDPWNGWQPLSNLLGGNPVLTALGNQITVAGATISMPLSLTGGALPSALTASGLPPGLSVNGNSIVGSPAMPGSYSVSITATDANGEKSAPMSFTWTVTGIAVPNVSGMTVARAISALRAAGLGIPVQHNVMDLRCDKPAGTVIGQAPRAGAQEPAGFVIHVDVETWPKGRFECN